MVQLVNNITTVYKIVHRENLTTIKTRYNENLKNFILESLESNRIFTISYLSRQNNENKIRQLADIEEPNCANLFVFNIKLLCYD